MGSEQTGQGQQPQWFGPEIIGGKIMNPGIDQQNMGRIFRHVMDVSSANYISETSKDLVYHGGNESQNSCSF
jgi:hypothetical protein